MEAMNFWGVRERWNPEHCSLSNTPNTHTHTRTYYPTSTFKSNLWGSGAAVHRWPSCLAVIEYHVSNATPNFPEFLFILCYFPYPKHGIDILLAPSLSASLPLSNCRQADPVFSPIPLIYYLDKKEQYQVLSATQSSFLKFSNLVLHCIFLLLDMKFWLMVLWNDQVTTVKPWSMGKLSWAQEQSKHTAALICGDDDAGFEAILYCDIPLSALCSEDKYPGFLVFNYH